LLLLVYNRLPPLRTCLHVRALLVGDEGCVLLNVRYAALDVFCCEAAGDWIRQILQPA
jgi:hypothetical protein